MKPRKKSYPPVNIGSSFMLVILIILCMVVFAVLSFSSALRDANYSQKKADRTTAYYQANNIAEEKLEQIDQVLSDTAATSALYTEEYQKAAIAELSKLKDITISTEEKEKNTIFIFYTVPIGETETLEVALTANNHTLSTDNYYCITKWKQVSTQEWNGNTSLPVLENP